jgi:hypothetical protein
MGIIPPITTSENGKALRAEAASFLETPNLFSQFTGDPTICQAFTDDHPSIESQTKRSESRVDRTLVQVDTLRDKVNDDISQDREIMEIAVLIR